MGIATPRCTSSTNRRQLTLTDIARLTDVTALSAGGAAAPTADRDRAVVPPRWRHSHAVAFRQCRSRPRPSPTARRHGAGVLACPRLFAAPSAVTGGPDVQGA